MTQVPLHGACSMHRSGGDGGEAESKSVELRSLQSLGTLAAGSPDADASAAAPPPSAPAAPGGSPCESRSAAGRIHA
eukprot:5670499-Prymnesium_polylepis.2